MTHDIHQRAYFGFDKIEETLNAKIILSAFTFSFVRDIIGRRLRTHLAGLTHF